MRKPDAGGGGTYCAAGGGPGTANACWQDGQLMVCPAHASSTIMCWLQWGQEILNSLMAPIRSTCNLPGKTIQVLADLRFTNFDLRACWPLWMRDALSCG